MDEARKLIERLVSQITSVEKDTEYGLHEPYAVPWPEIVIFDGDKRCECALCAGREYLARTKGGTDV